MGAAPVNPLLDPVNVVVEETVKAVLMSEGGLRGEVDIQGQFVVTVIDASKADLVAFKLNAMDKKFKFKVHPNLNKESHASNILEVKDPARGYKANVDAPLLKWRYGSSDESLCPLSLSCWPSPTADGIQLVIEYELSNESLSLSNVTVKIPAPSAANPEVISASAGALELSANCDESAIFPLTLEASKADTHLALQILEAYHMTSRDAIKYAQRCSCNYTFTVER